MVFVPEDIVLENCFLFIHYHGIIRSSWDSNFENNYGDFGVLYNECINSAFMLYKLYLDVLCLIMFDNATKKILFRNLLQKPMSLCLKRKN